MELTIEILLEAAKEKKASDLHITVGVPPKCRVNGNLENMEFPRLLPADTQRLLESILPESLELSLREKGEVDFSYSIPRLGRYRVNIFRQRGSMAAAIRLVETVIPTAERLGIPESVVELTKKKRGMVLVTGPTGSGKSTTLASLIHIINQNYNTHVITLEDPIEYLHNHQRAVINQREVGLDTMSYANALRAALREDPDVILLGEMRDLDTIATAITAAETGHLVFSTLHTIGAAATIDRIIDVFSPHQQQQIRIQLASVLESVISQQLIPVVGGKGRVAAYEVMHAVPAIKNLIREGKTHQIPSVLQTNRKLGMQTMDDAIFDLFVQGKIDGERAISFSQDPVAMERRIF
ncbi:type IV pilus twitching motility protein PilT [Acetivibrio ethanolgignens]|uniref:Type IV pili twitching motility protein PilT n=1 Tax=Acetivibrio ethanolgignens TaxID=290052 RepID=A0A0V8QBW5_9FIRM|nr:type IV pilus twitching motility protein PilT [Acetivibrio ethanolgignens]KSV57577.1 type IV pili twitching motility protein PilT [Acetivibrio ethanolgignens]